MTSRLKINFVFEEEILETTVLVKYHDDYYGSDIDGNRGELVRVIDNILIIGILDDQGNIISPSNTLIERINTIAIERL